jgi:hypothetical protein
MTTHRRFGGFAAVALVIAASVGVAEAGCLLPREREAQEIYALRMAAMVGAQSCNMLDRYNAFATKFNSELTTEGRTLKSYFIKSYGRGGENALDQFTTRMYNETVVRGDAREHFCAETGVLFDTLMGLNSDKLAPFAQARAKEALPSPQYCTGQLSIP